MTSSADLSWEAVFTSDDCSRLLYILPIYYQDIAVPVLNRLRKVKNKTFHYCWSPDICDLIASCSHRCEWFLDGNINKIALLLISEYKLNSNIKVDDKIIRLLSWNLLRMLTNHTKTTDNNSKFIQVNAWTWLSCFTWLHCFSSWLAF